MTPDKNFRLSKRSKTMVALLKMGTQSRNDFRDSMIQAELAAIAAHRAALRGKGSKQTD